jgi:dienelactone hydrolase
LAQRTFHDDARDRDIACTLYYPADAAGTDVASAAGTFPVLAIGHGFVMAVDAYTYLGEHYAEAGYIVVLPTTEGGLSPDHAAFGQDLAFVPGAMQVEGASEASLFFGHVGASTALMGHSMGGGAAVLGASGNGGIQALVVLAPAETTPSAIAAAGTVSVPTLVFAASEDCVTPIAQHARPIYDADGADCKALVTITGGGHCYFGDESFTCSLGEFTCGPDLTIDREEQHDVVLDLTDLWLDHFLRGSDEGFTAMLDSLGGSPRFAAESTCLSTNIMERSDPIDVAVRWDAAAQALRIDGVRRGDALTVFDATGRSLYRTQAHTDGTSIALPTGTSALVLVEVVRGDARRTLRVPVIY